MDTFVPSRPVHADAVSSLLASSFRMGPITELCYRNDSVQLITLACSLETGTLSPQGKQLRVGALVSRVPHMPRPSPKVLCFQVIPVSPTVRPCTHKRITVMCHSFGSLSS